MPFTRPHLIAPPPFILPSIHCSAASCPTLPPKPAYICSFERQIADKVHNNLVLRKITPAPIAAACPVTERSTFTTLAPLLRVRVTSALAKTDLGLSLPSALVDDNVIVTGKKNTRCKSSRNTKQNLELTTQNQSYQREKVSTIMNRIL